MFSLRNRNNIDHHTDNEEDKDSTLIVSPQASNPKQYANVATQTLSTGDIVITKIIFEEDEKTKENQPTTEH